MDFEVFMKKLEQRLNSVTFKGEELSECATGFNQGAMTMYNYALVAAYEMQAEQRKEAC